MYFERPCYFQRCAFLKWNTFTRLPGEEKKRVKHKVTRLAGYKRNGSHRRTEATKKKQNLEETRRKYRRKETTIFPTKTILESQNYCIRKDKCTLYVFTLFIPAM